MYISHSECREFDLIVLLNVPLHQTQCKSHKIDSETALFGIQTRSSPLGLSATTETGEASGLNRNYESRHQTTQKKRKSVTKP